MGYFQFANIIAILNLILSLMIIVILKSFIPETIGFFFKKKENLYFQRLGIYTEMVEVVSVSRKAASELVKNPKDFQSQRDFGIATNYLTTNLYKYRIFIHDDLYSELHSYKHLLQDFITCFDTITRSFLDKKEKEAVQERFEHIYSEIEKDHIGLIQKIKSYADSSLK